MRVLLPAQLATTETCVYFLTLRAYEGLPCRVVSSTGTDAEMVCPGGELAFVSQMVRDSAVLRDRIHWYSSMVGKKSTLKALKQLLRQHGASAVRTTELAQGEAHGGLHEDLGCKSRHCQASTLTWSC